MIKQLLRISFFTLFFVGLVIISRAEDFKAEMTESLEARQTSYNIRFTDRSHSLRKERNERERVRDALVRKERLEGVLNEWTKSENYQYAQVVKNVENIVCGITTHSELVDWFGLPDEVLRGDNFIPFVTRAGLRNFSYHFYMDQYPKPSEEQYIFARSFYFTEMRAPFVGSKLHILVTINGTTGLVEHYACFAEDGSILRYWEPNLITES